MIAFTRIPAGLKALAMPHVTAFSAALLTPIALFSDVVRLTRMLRGPASCDDTSQTRAAVPGEN